MNSPIFAGVAIPGRRSDQQPRHGGVVSPAGLYKWIHLLHWYSSILNVVPQSAHLTCFSDMQKFPLRMKDNDLLVTELYRDPGGDVITSISVYLTPKTSNLRLSLRYYSCVSIIRFVRQLDRDRLRYFGRERAGHRATPGNCGSRSAVVPNIYRSSSAHHEGFPHDESSDFG